MKVLAFLSLSFLLVTASVSANPKINGIDYSPFWNGQNPNGASPTHSQITYDLTLMKLLTKKVRLYGIDSSYYKFAAQACESLSIGYLVSAWTSFLYPATWSKARSDLIGFMKIADSLGYRHRDGIIYGYDNGADVTAYTEAQKVAWVIAEIDTLRAALKNDSIKISHEENWDVWIRHPELADSLDFVSIRIVPQTDLVPLAQACQYVKDCYAAVKKLFSNKEVRITAVGWATDGSCELEQKNFLDSLTADTVLDYYLCNFADEGWKSSPEGSYGIFTVDRQPKLFLYQPPATNSAVFFPKDSARLDAVAYNLRVFGYSAYISQPALENDVGRWADTMKAIAGVTFFASSDLLSSDGVVADAFFQNGNSMAINDYQTADTGLIKNNRLRAVFVDVTSSLYGYGSSTLTGRLKILDKVRHSSVIPIRANSKNDSIFIGATVPDYSYFSVDSLLRYPGVLQDLDGAMIGFDFNKYRGVTAKDSYIDSVMGSIVKLLAGKKLLVQLTCSALTYDYSNPGYYGASATYSALKKASNKYGFTLVISDIGNFYDASMSQPSQLYKFFLPGRFTSVIGRVNSPIASGLSLGNLGGKIVIRNAPLGTVLSLFDLSGRKVRQLAIRPGDSFCNLENEAVPCGIWLAWLKAGSQHISTKIIFSKE